MSNLKMRKPKVSEIDKAVIETRVDNLEGWIKKLDAKFDKFLFNVKLFNAITVIGVALVSFLLGR